MFQPGRSNELHSEYGAAYTHTHTYKCTEARLKCVFRSLRQNAKPTRLHVVCRAPMQVGGDTVELGDQLLGKARDARMVSGRRAERSKTISARRSLDALTERMGSGRSKGVASSSGAGIASLENPAQAPNPSMGTLERHDHESSLSAIEEVPVSAANG